MAHAGESELRDRVAATTADLVEYRTTEDRPAEIEAALSYVIDFFADEAVDIERFDHEGVSSLVVSLDGSRSPEIVFHGHLDVVPAADSMFTPRYVDAGELSGRGTADMKGGLATMMHVVRDCSRHESPPSLALMVVTDEERGGHHGARYLLEEGGYDPAFCITGEPNNLDGYLDIVYRQKGVIRIDLTATGASAHAATPEQGENAIANLMDAHPEIRAVFDAEDGDWPTTVNYGLIEGGTAINQVPDRARLRLDVRYPDADARDRVLTALRGIDGLTVESVGHGAPVDTDPDDPHVRGLQRHAERVIGRDVNLVRKPHTSDLRHFATHGIPGVAFGPEAYGSHEGYEYLVVDSLPDYYRALTAFVEGAPYE
ncbi:M20 family metallopeptidase [Haloplanus aerogenes]|uniref:M20 family peptidase n=1 Tax=Haloplanus aerogenes TaxID=660522 RepID=A0A3M0DTS4_9EURY|nr:M20/M25/M40 family metallo-hydrolase [Haloplanus aerogenes]AZH25653.1 M20 family peptidase [Haloplanus aerogenes]RMB25381.1 succinyl-diaminopimelate desuccinylase [Haloplanus aerogenes]